MGIPRTHATMASLSNLPLAPASQHSSFFQRVWALLIHVAPAFSLPSACPSHQAGPGQGPSRWLETTSCLTCSPQGLSRNGRAWHQKGNCYLATGPPPSLKILAEMKEQTTQPSTSGGLTGGGLDHTDQNQRQQPRVLAKEFSAKVIKCRAWHPEHVPTEFLVLSAFCQMRNKDSLINQKVVTGKLSLKGNSKVYSCPIVTTFLSQLLMEFYPCLSPYFECLPLARCCFRSYFI